MKNIEKDRSLVIENMREYCSRIDNPAHLVGKVDQSISPLQISSNKFTWKNRLLLMSFSTFCYTKHLKKVCKKRPDGCGRNWMITLCLIWFHFTKQQHFLPPLFFSMRPKKIPTIFHHFSPFPTIFHFLSPFFTIFHHFPPFYGMFG